MTIEWTRQSSRPGYDSVSSLAFAGGIVTVGYSRPGPDNQSNPLPQVAVISKQDLDGKEIWTKQLESSGDSIAKSVCGGENTIFVCGSTSGAISSQTSAGGTDAFLCAFDSNGSLTWACQFGSKQNDTANSISFFDNKIYVAGTSYSDTPVSQIPGAAYTFLDCYDTTGGQIWSRQVDTSWNNDCASVFASETGIYLTGTSYGPFSSGLPAGSSDVFVGKYDFTGNRIWLTHLSSEKDDRGQSITAVGDETFVFGTTYGSMDSQVNLGDSDAFLTKLDKNGNKLWTKQFGTPAADFAGGISSHSGNMYFTGYTNGTFTGQRNSGGSDVFVGSYSTDGKQLSLIEFGTGKDDFAYGLQVSALGIYVCGSTKGNFQGFSIAGTSDAFVVKLHDRC